ncbi:hypothetical protein RJ640_011401 [Escallonia rubra]|uniref:Uncharacterized protein n=1 Tax=Escallonia rubra TaxID=112253 RepID=A0AA88UF74_9ASTE|nr:hypothetical protein RJ640_011401 [Escallonia rubra]
MAGGNHIKNSSSKPSSSSSSHRKSRWESGNTHHHPPSDKKPSSSAAVAGGNDPKSPSVPPLKSKPPSRSNPTPSPGHPKPPSDRALQPGSGPSPSGAPFHYPDPLGPPPPQIPAYDFHMLERRTIALADGSVRSYFALPPDYDDFAPPLRPMDPTGRFHPEMPRPGFGFDRHFGPMGPEFLDRDRDDIFNRNPDNTLKRKYGDEGIEGNDDFARQRRQLLQYGNAGSNSHGYSLGLGGRGEFVVGTSSPMVRGGEMRASKNMRLDGGYEGGRGNVGPLRHNEVDQEALKKAFLYFAKLVNENPAQRNNYLADGKQGPVQCVACGRFDSIGFKYLCFGVICLFLLYSA